MTHGGSATADPTAIVPDGGWGWVIVFASLMIHFIMDGITYSMGDVFLTPMMENLNETRGPVSTIWGILPAVTLMTGPIATVLTNTYGCKKVTLVGATIAASGFLASYFWANVYYYYLTIGVIGGFGFGLIYLPAIVSVGYYFEKKRSFAMGIAVCGSGLGTMAFPFIMPHVITAPLWFDYDGALLLEAAVIFICVIFGALMIPLPQEPSEKRRVERKSLANTKRQASNAVALISPTSVIDEQRNQLLPIRESDVPLQEIRVGVRESSAVVPGDQQRFSDDKRRVSLSDVTQNQPKKDSDSTKANSNKNLAKSLEHINQEGVSDEPVVAIRKDALYQGSTTNIPMFNEDPDEYHRMVAATSETVDQPVNESVEKKQEKKSFLRQITEQIDLKLLQDGAFALFAVSNFLTSLGFNVPYNFANDLAGDAGVPAAKRHDVIMAIGIANCFGRITIGYLADRRWINRLFMYNITLIIAGLATMAAPMCNAMVYQHMIYGAFFGFFSGGYVGLTSIIIVDLMGVDKLSDAFGSLLLFQGVAVAIGTPIVGVMRDVLQNYPRPYLWPYLIFGGSIALSGVILFAIPMIRRRQERRTPLTQHQLDMGVLSYTKPIASAPQLQ